MTPSSEQRSEVRTVALERLVRAASPFVNAVVVMAEDRKPGLSWLADAATALGTVSPSDEVDVERPTKEDFGVAIELLKRHGMAGIEAAVFHGAGATARRTLEAAESVTRMVAWLRVQREETCP